MSAPTASSLERAAPTSAQAATLLDFAQGWERTAGDRLWLTQPLGGGRLRRWTWREALDEARRLAAHLAGLQLPAPSNIALCSKNCAWWFMADLAIWMAGHVSVPLYPNLTADVVRHVLDHSQARFLFVGKLDPVWEEMKRGVPPRLPCVTFPLSPAHEAPGWDDVVSAQAPLERAVRRSPDEVATIVYTSGTTGMPKGAMISFGAMSAVARQYATLLEAGPADRVLSYLPLAHVFERALVESGGLFAGFQVSFAESPDTFLADLRRVRPSQFLSVPRLWMMFRAGVLREVPPARLDRLLAVPLLRGLVRRRILRKLGLDRVRITGSASAPLPAEVITWYRKLGIELLEGYALTENFGYSHLGRPGKTRPGCVGPPLPGVECRLGADGEVQVRSPGAMLGYFRDAAATAETFTADGFLRTGDLGAEDPDGQLRITGRAKEPFKTTGGHYVSPAPIETRLRAHPGVGECCVCGSGLPQPYAVVVPSESARQRLGAGDRPAVEGELLELLKGVNRDLAHHEQLAFVAVVDDDWLPENGFLTPTLKVKRARIESAYGKLAQHWLEEGKGVVWKSRVPDPAPPSQASRNR